MSRIVCEGFELHPEDSSVFAYISHVNFLRARCVHREVSARAHARRKRLRHRNKASRPLVRKSWNDFYNIVSLGHSTMTMSIGSIVLYSRSGEQRQLTFKKGCLNVITGDSKTGKSAIIDIIDYCLGRSHCNVAEGVIRRSVSWFALEVSNRDDILFIARKNPGPGTDTSADIYVRRGKFDSPPPLEELHKNIVENELIVLLTRFLGIAENEHKPKTGTRLPLQATIRHALFLCFQKQDEIDNRDRLFHRQGEQFILRPLRTLYHTFSGPLARSIFCGRMSWTSLVKRFERWSSD
jgi:hypothetical protein